LFNKQICGKAFVGRRGKPSDARVFVNHTGARSEAHPGIENSLTRGGNGPVPGRQTASEFAVRDWMSGYSRHTP
jgi:hypothetical protein